ncbi:hypothetical protein [Alteromonas lipolytica]|nr:hypothetical protein [Alteromonas lipolytica]GGF53889.1 hypothetical protein GCM10011338_02540 [Alteromonas lipolytica]
MDKKKVISVLSVLGLAGGLMFSVSALSADTISDARFAGGTLLDSTVPGCDNGKATGNPHCNNNPDD